MTEDRITHWDSRYAGAAPEALSWFEATPSRSLSLIRHAVGRDAGVIDIGGGASRLPDALLEAGYGDLTVLDLSAEALSRAQARLGARAGKVRWQVADVTRWRPDRRYDLWHDRAVFHFLTEPRDRAAYARAMPAALAPGGTAIIMTFAQDGPETCSGLPVVRYSPGQLADEIDRLLPEKMEAKDSGRHEHTTPGGSRQQFQFVVFRRRDDSG